MNRTRGDKAYGRTFKLIVQPDDNSIKVLRYLDNVIVKINQMGVYFKITRLRNKDLTPSLVQDLARNNISRLPVVITDDGKHWVGFKEIKSKIYSNIKLYEQNMSRAQLHRDPYADMDDPLGLRGTPGLSSRVPTSISEFMNEELRHLEKVGDGYRFDDDTEEDGIGGDQGDFRKGMEEFQRRRATRDPGRAPSSIETKLDELQHSQPARGGNAMVHEPSNIMNDPELNNEDLDILNKIGGGDYASMDGYNDNIVDDEEMYRRQAMSEFDM